MYPRVRLHPGREKSLHFRHPWLFSRAISHVPRDLGDGSLVSIENAEGKVMATGYHNGRSQIALRILSFDEATIDEMFFVKKFEECLAFRQRFLDFSSTDAYRLVFSESDGLPGLIVDRYGDFVVVQVHTLGMDLLKPLVVSALVKVLKPKGIYERSDLDVRRKEGLSTLPKGVLYGEEPPKELGIMENGLKFAVDIPNGQKTGFFLDQRENRLSLRKYVEGKTVLNLFSYSGGFSVSALKGGAVNVTSVDVSEAALELARKNFSLNGFDPSAHRFEKRDVFEFLDGEAKNGARYDVIVVDPPAFVKNRDSLNHGINAYIKLNHKALELLNDEGILVSSSCSSHVTPEMFRTVLFKAALESKREMVLLEQKIQPPDHPLNVNFPEGEYLKFFVCSAGKI